MKVVAIFASLALFMSSSQAVADPIGNDLADSVCLTFSFPALPTTYVTASDFDVTDPSLGNEGLIYDEHGRQWLQWSKINLSTASIGEVSAFYATCKIYKQAAIPDETSVPTTAFVVKADKAVGPGELWFSYRKDP